ncbi:hypothetical protein BDR05DRAFT_964767 [Suillus weaverae]|nr:hypothetical protein BDR05DRAFT_964767 [Suillus weaverae]
MHVDVEGNLFKTFDFRSSCPRRPIPICITSHFLCTSALVASHVDYRKLDTTHVILVVAFYQRVHELEERWWLSLMS